MGYTCPTRTLFTRRRPRDALPVPFLRHGGSGMNYVCTRCKSAKPFEEMSKRSSRPNGLHGWCKSCMNARARDRSPTREQVRGWNIKHRYGISQDQVDQMMSAQGGVCAICGEVPSRPVIDHNHSTGKVRGVLCHPCNIKLHSLDKWPHLASALRYLGGDK